MTKYAIVDVANLFFRAQNVTQGDAFTKAGMALHIVFKALRYLHKNFQVNHMVFAVEGSNSWRYSVFPQYKASRIADRATRTQSEIEEATVFISVMNDFITYLKEKTRCTVLHAQRIEGDDFVARWIQTHPNDEHIILSGDSDFIQLLDKNVSIYNGMTKLYITPFSVTNEKDQHMSFSIDSGKIKLGKHDEEFIPESDWYKKLLFIKIIRGDDGIFSAYPGVRLKGSSKKVGINEAWADRSSQGYHWNNFFLQKWSKLLPDGSTKDVLVKDEFAFNEMLIDLTKQPDDIKDIMDETIAEQIMKPLVENVGINFMQFCNNQSLPNVLKEAKDHSTYLNARYKKIN